MTEMSEDLTDFSMRTAEIQGLMSSAKLAQIEQGQRE
jgi:hypothetical protein